MQYAPHIEKDSDEKNFTDRTARGDYIKWLHLGKWPADSMPFAPLMNLFQVSKSSHTKKPYLDPLLNALA